MVHKDLLYIHAMHTYTGDESMCMDNNITVEIVM